MDTQVVVSFPGLGIGEITLNPVAFTLFGKFEVRWYGLLITLGMVLAVLYVMWRAKKSEGIKSDDVIDTGLVVIPLGILGARLYYVFTSLENYHSFYDVIAIWNGGLGIYGGIIGGALAIFIVSRFKKIKPLRLYDAIVPAVIMAQIIGRWGNFFNGEAYGYQITEAGTTRYFFFLKEFSIPAGEGTLFHWLRMGLSPNEFSSSLAYVHPTFLYEGIWNLCGFILLNLLYRKKKYNGQIFITYLTWYGFGRMFIEGLRSDSLYVFKGLFGTDGVRISQLVGLVCFLTGTALLILIPVLRKDHPGLLAYQNPATVTAPEAGEPPMREKSPEPTVEEPLETNDQLPFEETIAEQMFARPNEEVEPEPIEELPEAEETPAETPEAEEGPAQEEPAEKPADETPPKPAPKPRRKPPTQRGTVSLPGKKKKPAKKPPLAQRGKDHADH